MQIDDHVATTTGSKLNWKLKRAGCERVNNMPAGPLLQTVAADTINP